MASRTKFLTVPPLAAMRTTLALLAICGDEARWLHVGDSRIYWFRRGVLMSRTRDHSVAELTTELDGLPGVAPPDPDDRNRLTRAMGAGRVRASVGNIVALHDDDAFLICSDGLWGALPDEILTACLAGARQPDDWSNALDQHLLESGTAARWEDQDNYTMICVFTRPDTSESI